jgi:hypothetical protein
VRVSKWLKDLERMFYGSCESYEKVRSVQGRTNVDVLATASYQYVYSVTMRMCAKMQALKGQEDMADVLLRNVYGDDNSKRHNAVALAQYVRRLAKDITFNAAPVVLCANPVATLTLSVSIHALRSR